MRRSLATAAALAALTFVGSGGVLLSGLLGPRLAGADPPTELAAFRARLQAFQTVWVRFEVFPQKSRGHNPLPSGVIRIERATGRVSVDYGTRYLWDGTHVWKDERNDLPAQQLGAEADTRMAEFMAELLAGLPNTAVIPPGTEDWGAWFGWRLDLPFTWDDDYAILLAGAGGPQDRDRPTRLVILNKATKELAELSGNPLHLPLSVHWDVRLFDDLSEPESLGSRQVRVSPPGEWDEVWEGPVKEPGWHVQTTRDALLFDPAGSAGWIAPSTGIEVPQVRLEDATCTAAGQVIGAPLTLVYHLDFDAPGADYLPGALSAGCAFRLDLGAVHDHRPALGAKTRVRGTVKLQDTTTTPPTVLGQRAFDETVEGPNKGRRGKDHVLSGVPATFDPTGLELRFDGTVEVRCVQAGAGPSSVAFGIDQAKSPVLAWPGCYPELGVVP